MKKILVTGGSGFLGSHLCEYLLKKGNEVICVDNLLTASKDNIKPFLDDKNFHFIMHDITIPFTIYSDEIYNLACPASPVHYQKNPINTIKTNVLGAINVLEMARLSGARVLQASTSEVYGDPKIHPQVESYWGHVNSFGDRSCFSDDTEILTENGWKLFQELREDEKVASLNKEDVLEYHVPDEIIIQNFNGKLLHFENWNIDLSVTSNHKMYVNSEHDKNFVFKEANKVTSKNGMKKTCLYDAPEVEFFELDSSDDVVSNCKKDVISKVKMDDWLEFIGYYITEGSTHIHKSEKRYKSSVNSKEYPKSVYKVQISQSDKIHPEIFNKIKNCLDRLGFHYTISRNGNCYFMITNKQLALNLIKLGKSREKYIPREFLSVSKRQLKILFDAMMDGDGSITKTRKNNDKWTYYSSSKKLMDNMQEICIKLGYFINIKKVKTRDLYEGSIVFREKNIRYYPKFKEEDYNGKVYCVNVKNHVIMVRRNGKAVFSVNCYDEGKRVAETLFYDYEKAFGIDIRVARIFNTYGPKMCVDDGRVVSNFIVQAIKDKDITIYGDGSQTRSFGYVSDTIEGLVKLMASDYKRPVNIGNPNEFTVRQLADLVISLLRSKSKIVHMPLPSDDPCQRQPDITLAKNILGWTPKVNLYEGLRETIDYFLTKI